MLDEIVFMQMRLFRQFRDRTGLGAVAANEIWEAHDIWGFIRRCYDSLHLGSDDLALDDVFAKLSHQGVVLSSSAKSPATRPIRSSPPI